MKQADMYKCIIDRYICLLYGVSCRLGVEGGYSQCLDNFKSASFNNSKLILTNIFKLMSNTHIYGAIMLT